MKKRFIFLVAIVMTLSMLLGTISALAQDELYEVVMQYPTLGSTPQDSKLVEDKINERIEKEIGVHLTLYPASAFTLNSTTSLMVSSNEKLDLPILIAFPFFQQYFIKGITLGGVKE